MPRNQILPPVSFIRDLSNPGNSLIQALFEKGKQDTGTERTVSFEDRLRSRSVDAEAGRTPSSAESTQQKPRSIRDTDRRERPQPAATSENRISRPKRSRRQKAAENQQATNQLPPGQNDQPASRLDTTSEPKVDHSEPTDNSPPVTESSDSVDSLQQHESQQPERSSENPTGNPTENREDQQNDVDSVGSKSENGNVPAGLLKHVSEGIRSNSDADDLTQNSDSTDTDDGNLHPPVISKGLANALQGQTSNQQNLLSSDHDSPANSANNNDASENGPQKSSDSNPQEQNDLSGINASQPEVSGQTSQQGDQTEKTAAGEPESSQDGQDSTEPNTAGQVDAAQKQRAIEQAQTDGDNNPEIAQQPSQDDIAQIQTAEADGERNRSAQDQSNVPAQNQQEKSIAENSAVPAPNSAGELKDPGSEEKAEAPETSEQETHVSEQNEEQGQKQNQVEQPTTNIDFQTSPVDDTAGKAKAEKGKAQPGDAGQKKSSHQIPAHLQPQYSRATQQTAFTSKPISENHPGTKADKLPVDQLTNVTGQVTSSDFSDANSAKSTSADPFSSANATPVRSSGETPAAVQARPVLEITRSDMSQKLSSFIQQASESGKAMRIRLDPPELGSMQIEVGRVNGQVVARIEVDNPHARALVLEQLHLLRASLHQQNLRVDRLEVEINENLTREFTSDQSGNQSPGNQTSGNQQQRFGEETEFASVNQQLEEQNNAPVAETEAHERQIVGVSEIDVHI